MELTVNGARESQIMTMTPSFRKLVLTLHVITTMGWLGSAAAYIPIAANVLTNSDTEMIRSSIQIMALVADFVVVPMAFASLFTGVALSLGTKWGLFRHYWVLFKIFLTAFAVFFLVAYTQVLSQAASIAKKSTLSITDISILKNPIHIIHPSGGLLVVLVATVLAVYKPKGMTRYGWRKQLKKRNNDSTPHISPRWVKMAGVAAIVSPLLIVLLGLFKH